MSKHTPGPWLINTAGSAIRGGPFKITEIYVYAPKTQDDTAICADVIDPVTQEPSEANAHLIAAAPELLYALKQMVEIAELTIGWFPTPEGADGPLIVARAALRAEPVSEPYAYAVYFPDQPCIELVHDLDDLVDAMTNREHEVTPLYAAPQSAVPLTKETK